MPLELDFEPGTAETGSAVTTRVSGARYFAKGDWDKIPYSVEVTTHAVFTCKPEEMYAAEQAAFIFASNRSLQRLSETVPALIETITEDLYPELFREEPDD